MTVAVVVMLPSSSPRRYDDVTSSSRTGAGLPSAAGFVVDEAGPRP
jgi:hypothetical protein